MKVISRDHTRATTDSNDTAKSVLVRLSAWKEKKTHRLTHYNSDRSSERRKAIGPRLDLIKMSLME